HGRGNIAHHTLLGGSIPHHVRLNHHIPPPAQQQHSPAAGQHERSQQEQQSVVHHRDQCCTGAGRDQLRHVERQVGGCRGPPLQPWRGEPLPGGHQGHHHPRDAHAASEQCHHHHRKQRLAEHVG